MALDNKTIGAWLVHHANKLSNFKHSPGFDNVRLAGRAGVLLSALSKNEQGNLTNEQVAALAMASDINPMFELPVILDKLSAQKLIDKGQTGIEVLGLTTETVLQHTSDLFAAHNPSAAEHASIELAELCSAEPTATKELSKFISDKYQIVVAETEKLLGEAETYGFTDAEATKSGEKLFFNGNLFRREELTKVEAVLTSLSPQDRKLVKEVDDILTKKGCVLMDEAKKILGEPLFKKLNSIGMYDASVVSNSSENVAFITKPSAFSKYGNAAVSDAFDLTKALVASLSYGIHRSTSMRGRIVMIEALMSKLINGYWVGPAPAIGQDYKVLELKNVVQVKRDGSSFSMRLLKKEVGQLALQIIRHGDASEQSLPNFPGASITSFTPPEETRSKVRLKQRELQEKEIGSILQTLRTGRHIK